MDIYNAGHIIANHTYYHYNNHVPHFAEYRDDIIRCQDLIYEITGEPPKFFRPPKGLIRIKTVYLTMSLRLKILLWSVEGYEWNSNKHCNSKVISDYVLSALKGGDIILLHDNNPKIVEVLNTILPNIKEMNLNTIDWVKHLI